MLDTTRARHAGRRVLPCLPCLLPCLLPCPVPYSRHDWHDCHDCDHARHATRARSASARLPGREV